MIVVVGAGPAGLAMAHELQRCGLPYRVLERQTVGYSWLNHYERLHLHIPKQVSNLPDQPMPTTYPQYPSALQFRHYLARYAEEQRLAIETGIEVRHAAYDGNRWRLETSQGPVEADMLVVATGIWSTPYRAHFPGQEVFGGPILHASEYFNAFPFAGQRVLVIGAGNSGSEIAVDLAEHGVTTAIAIRDGVAFVPRPTSPLAMRAAAWFLRTVPRPLAERMLRRRDFSAIGLPLPPGSPLDHFPVVGYDLPEAVAAGRVRRYGGIARFAPGKVYFDDGREYACDAIILATGYRPTVDFVAHELRLDANGTPLVDREWRAIGNPRLYCVGFWYPTTEGWLQSIGRVARTAARSIARQLR
jgi:putative flavoprotein involved in K+ transport